MESARYSAQILDYVEANLHPLHNNFLIFRAGYSRLLTDFLANRLVRPVRYALVQKSPPVSGVITENQEVRIQYRLFRIIT